MRHLRGLGKDQGDQPTTSGPSEYQTIGKFASLQVMDPEESEPRVSPRRQLCDADSCGHPLTFHPDRGPCKASGCHCAGFEEKAS